MFWACPSAPVYCNLLNAHPAEARAVQRGAIELAHCTSCDLVYNVAFDPGLVQYSAGYENALHCSPRFRGYAEALAGRLVDRYRLRGRTIVEIGCGDGYFLTLLCQKGNNRGIGYDPSMRGRATLLILPDRVRIVPETLRPGEAEATADLICCRHVLEHLPDPLAFLQNLCRLCSRAEGVVFIEVPNAEWMLRELAVWDAIYEHCSYFTRRSLGSLLERAGLEVMRVGAEYGDQYLAAEARPRGPDDRSRGAVGGAGSKGVTFLNALGAGAAAIDYVVDLNSRKHGRFVPGTGQCVVGPERLKTAPADLLIVMNGLYVPEIRAMLDDLGVTTDVQVA